MTPFDLWRRNTWCNQQVAGESFRIDSIRPLFPAKLPDRAEISKTADLIPEPTNPHDRNAVAVRVDGRHVGYLPREDAAKYQPMLLNLVSRSLQPQVPCNIRAWEWTEHTYDRRDRLVENKVFNVDVSLALDEPHLCVPINNAPSDDHVTMPHGSAIQVTGEEAHLDALLACLRPEGAAWVHATAHAITEQRKAGRELVEIRIDGQRVGQLTPKMSAELLPAIHHLASAGMTTAIRAIVHGNRLKAEVVLYTARAHQLPADWPGDAIPSSVRAMAVAPQQQPAPPPGIHLPIPPKPTRIRFNIPPNWPQDPPGWEPFPGWAPPPEWPPAPNGWQFWVLEA